LLVVFLVFSQCDSTEDEPYSNISIIVDNAKAAMYFHTVFREAERAWYVVDSMDYKSFVDTVTAGTAIFKIYTYDDEANTVTVSYNAWVTDNGLALMGTLRVGFEKFSYRVNGRIASVSLTNFSINNQDIRGVDARITNRNEEDENHNDLYDFTIPAGAAIHEVGIHMPVIISASITNGRYERAEDGAWIYWGGTMSGMIRGDVNLSYSNTIISTSTNLAGETVDTRLRYSADCIIAQWGVSKIVVSGRPDIFFEYRCSQIYYRSEPVLVF